MEEVCAARSLDRSVDRFEGVMEPMTQLLNSDKNSSPSTGVQELNGKYWLGGTTSKAVVPVPCRPFPSGMCSCGLPRCCQTVPYYQTHIYGDFQKLEHFYHKPENPYFH